ncbi:MAG: hypothetical protein ACRDF9_14980, partial [Candidatus Limnocylindria bacterium]
QGYRLYRRARASRACRMAVNVTVPRWMRWWLFGALTGITMLSVMFLGPLAGPLAFPLAFAALVILVVRSPERAAFGGGALTTTGLWFLYALRGAVERCAEIDRSPTGSCSIYGVEEQAIAMGLYLAVGIGLSLRAASRRRSLVSSGPSAAVPRRR